jgi:hypothetical protein
LVSARTEAGISAASARQASAMKRVVSIPHPRA